MSAYKGDLIPYLDDEDYPYGVPANGAPIAQQPPPVVSALDRLRAHQAQRPTENDPNLKPTTGRKILGSLAAGGIGFAAGYFNPKYGKVIDPNLGGAVGGEIIHGKYNAARRKWADESDKLATIASIEQKQEAAAQDKELHGLRSETQRKLQAEADTRMAKLNQPPPPPKPLTPREKLIGTPGGLYDAEQGKLVEGTGPAAKPEPAPKVVTSRVGNQLYEKQGDGTWKKVAEAPREPRTTSPTEEKRQEVALIRKIANRVLNDTLKKGGSEQNAIENAQKFYADDPEVSAYRAEVIEHLKRLAALRTEPLKAGGGSSLLDRAAGKSGGKPQPKPAPTAVTQPSGKIRVRRKSDGATGTLDAKDFDPSAYEKL